MNEFIEDFDSTRADGQPAAAIRSRSIGSVKPKSRTSSLLLKSGRVLNPKNTIGG
jgi:hypothetical protein